MTVWLPTVDGPTDLPDLRDWLLHHWREGTALADVFTEAPWFRRTLQTAALWWVEPDTCEILAASAPTIPADTVLNLHDLPTPSGFAVFANDLEGIDADPTWNVLGGKCRVSGIMWGPITVAVDGTVYEVLSIGSFSRSVFRDGTIPNSEIVRVYPMITSILGGFDGDEYRQVVEGNIDRGIADRYPKSGELFAYLGRSDWMPGACPDDLLPGDDDGIPARALISKAEDRRLVAALWALTRSNVATVTTPKIPRPAARRAQRKGLDPKVRVLTLGGERVTRGEHVGVSDVEWKHSWIVSPHFRWQVPRQRTRRTQADPRAGVPQG